MAIPVSAWNEIISSTLYNRSASAADNVTKHNALFFRLKEKGKVKPFEGGLSMVEHLEYATQTTTDYSGWEPIALNQVEHLTSAEYQLKMKAVPIMISGLEMLQNTSKYQVIDLLESRVGNGEKSLINSLANDAYGDGTANGGKVMGGLGYLIPDDPTTSTSIGGINQADNSFWRSVKWGAATDGSAIGAMSATTIQAHMNRLWMKLVRGTDKPDLIVFDQVFYGYYWQSLQAIQRICDESKLGQAGFQTIKYMGSDVVFEGTGVSIPASHGYFLNTDYLKYRPAKDRNIEAIGGDRLNTSQDGLVRLLGWAGNLTCSNRSLQGVLLA